MVSERVSPTRDFIGALFERRVPDRRFTLSPERVLSDSDGAAVRQRPPARRRCRLGLPLLARSAWGVSGKEWMEPRTIATSTPERIRRLALLLSSMLLPIQT